MTTDGAKNLYQRLQAVAADVKPIKPTGQNEFKRSAISIGDVEEAVGPPLAEHGVITRWSYAEGEGLIKLENRLWLARLVVRLTNADDPADFVEDAWLDIGSNPMAACSFARKGYYKALFHLADDDEEAGGSQDRGSQDRGSQQSAGRASGTPGRERPPAQPVPTPSQSGSTRFEQRPPQAAEAREAGELDPDEKVCPRCGAGGTLRRKREEPDRAFCAAGVGGCGKSCPAAEVVTRAQYLAAQQQERLKLAPEPAGAAS